MMGSIITFFVKLPPFGFFSFASLLRTEHLLGQKQVAKKRTLGKFGKQIGKFGKMTTSRRATKKNMAIFPMFHAASLLRI